MIYINLGTFNPDKTAPSVLPEIRALIGANPPRQIVSLDRSP
jgi:hypothetical protein